MIRTMAVMALAATLALGTFSNSAFAFTGDFEIPDRISEGDGIKITSKGNAVCTDSFGDDCGVGKQKSNVRLLITQIDDDAFSGVGKATISLKIHQMGGMELKGYTLGFAYVPNAEKMMISGPLKASNGSTWQLDMNIAEIAETQNDRFQAECSSTLTAPNGSAVVSDTSCGLVLNPINS